ncbi:unnamed protein product [Discula destructiva]
MEGIIANNTTAPNAAAPLPLDAGSIFVLAVTLLVFCGPLFVLFPPFPPSKSDALEETHNKLGLDRGQSNLTRRDHAAAENGRAKIESLFVYPIKSCKGIEVARSKVIPTGLEFDRLFTFAQLKSPFPVSSTTTAANGATKQQDQQQHSWDFITQRQFPRLATVETELWQPDLAKMKGFRDPAAGASHEVYLLLRFPWRAHGIRGAWATFAAKCTRGWRASACIEVLLPVGAPSPSPMDDDDAAAADEEMRRRGYSRETVRVWGDRVPALNMASELPEELRLYLGVSNRLALFQVDPAGALREAARNAPGREEAGYQPVVGFADSYPVHIMNLASVQDLESKVAKDMDLEELSPRRFRANIFVSGRPAYDEDDWKMIKLSRPQASAKSDEEATFHVSCRTTRCKLPNVNQDTGIRHSVEPDKTLRAQRAIDAGAPKTGCLGMQMTPLFGDSNGSQHFYLEVGMLAEVLERGEHMIKK